MQVPVVSALTELSPEADDPAEALPELSPEPEQAARNVVQSAKAEKENFMIQKYHNESFSIFDRT
jgi:hypothetical protein